MSTTCFNTRFPRIMGGNSAYTNFSSMDIDSSNNIVVGGGTNDAGVSSSANLEAPFAMYILSGDYY